MNLEISAICHKIFNMHVPIFHCGVMVKSTSAMVFMSWWILVCPRRLPSGAWMRGACFFIGHLRSLVVRALERYSKDPGSSPGGDACFSH